MKIRYIIDMDISTDEFEEQVELANDIKYFIENHQYGYDAKNISVKMQDEYCLSQEKIKK